MRIKTGDILLHTAEFKHPHILFVAEVDGNTMTFFVLCDATNGPRQFISMNKITLQSFTTANYMCIGNILERLDETR